MDADLGLPDINVVMGLIPPPRYNLYHVITGRRRISEIVTEGPYGVRLITGAVGINEIANLSSKKRNEILAELAGLGNFIDLIIIDTGAGLTSNILGFVLTADEVILVTTPEPPAIADAYGMIKAIASESKDVNIKLIVNRVRSILEGKAVADRIVNIVAQFLSMRVEKLGYIVEDKAVAKAIRKQKPLLTLYPTSKSSNCILHIRNKLIQAPSQLPRRGFRGFLARLLGIETEYY
jgi:flagellar biosynthesis protein FlhG